MSLLVLSRRFVFSGMVLVCALAGAAVSGTEIDYDDERVAALPVEHREWLRQVSLLITEEELDYFLSLEEEFRRAAFRERFWEVRDPVAQTGYNELKRAWTRRIERVLFEYGALDDDRAKMLLLNGEPGRFRLPDGRVISICYDRERHLEIWFYGGSERSRSNHFVILYRRAFQRDAPYRVWRGFERLEPDRRFKLPTTDPSQFCEDDIFARVVSTIRRDSYYSAFVDRLLSLPEPPSREWVSTFASFTTELPAGVPTFEVETELAFPGRNQNRTAVQGVLRVTPPPAEAAAPPLAARQYLLTGEVIRNDSLLENFRYRFEVPVPDDGADLPLVFQRYLRPGPVELRLKLEDLRAGSFATVARRFKVPSATGLASMRGGDSHLQRLLAEANAAAERGQRTIRIVPPPDSSIQIGGVRFTTVTAGEFDHVSFYLNGKELMTKRKPPFSVELNLGSIAASHRLRVVAYDEEGGEAASDEILVNRGGQRFRVRLTEPRTDRKYSGSLSAVAQVEVPDGQHLDRLEIFLDEQRVATLFQPPFVQAILLEHDRLAYVRAVAYLTDGLATEDVVFVNAPDYFEQVDVNYVELFASVVDGKGRPILGLERADFRVVEDGVDQEIRRFEFVENLPIHAGLLLDTSASMEGSLGTVAEAAKGFVTEAMRPSDRFALFSFSERANIEVRFTGESDSVTQALDGLRAEGTTALFDSLVFALHYFDGVKGQKALLLLSDGRDEASRFDFAGALQTAQRAGVTVYVIGLEEAARDKEARKILEAFAAETGGRSFFIEDAAELSDIYRLIQEDLRTQYLIAYQSSSNKDENEFRRIKVLVGEKGAEVRTLSGYYP